MNRTMLFILLILICLSASGCETINKLNRAADDGYEKDWVTFGLNAGASLIRLNAVDILAKTDEKAVPASKGVEAKAAKFCTVIFSHGLQITECAATAELRDNRFRELSKHLHTLE